jgi:hypothetical protein
MKRPVRLLTATALASFVAALGAQHLSAQVPGPGYAASITGAASTTTSTAFNIIQFGAGWNTAYRIYITGVQCGRTDAGTSAIKVTFNDTGSTVIVLPNSGGGGMVSVHYESPLQVAADTNLTGTASANTTTVYCSAQGFVAN